MKRLFLPIAFGCLVACASLVGLDDSDTLPAGSSSGSSGNASSSGTGQINQDGLTITPKDLTLAAFKCNESVESPPITLENTSEVDQDYEATLPTNDVFTIKSGASGKVAKHNTASIVLEARSAKPATAAVQLAIKTQSGVANVSVKVDVQGVILKIAPDKPDFGLVKEGQQSAPINAIFTNEGNVPITFSGFDGTAGDLANFTLPSTVVVDANKSATYPITMTGGSAGPTITALATAKIADPNVLCGAPSPTLTLTGRRVSDDVIVNPVSADFGTATCNATSSDNSTQTIKVSNFSTTMGATWTATLPTDSHFTVTPSGSLEKAANADTPQQQDIKIQVKSTGDTPAKITEMLTVHTVGAKTADTKITLTLEVDGGVIQITPASLDDIANGATQSATIKNVGNEPICIKTSSTNGAFSPTKYSSAPIVPGFSYPLDVKFSATAGTGKVTGAINIGPSDSLVCFGGSYALCKTPPPLPVSGNAP